MADFTVKRMKKKIPKYTWMLATCCDGGAGVREDGLKHALLES